MTSAHKVLFLIATVLMATAAWAGDASDIQRQLTLAQLEALEAPIYTKEIVNTPAGKILVLTRDYGSGLEIRDAYVYRYAADVWELVAYRTTSNARIDARIRAGILELVAGNAPILAMPVESLFPEPQF